MSLAAANWAIDALEARERRRLEERDRIRHLVALSDQILNELEVLNLRDRDRVPERLSRQLGALAEAVGLMDEGDAVAEGDPAVRSTVRALDLVFGLQERLFAESRAARGEVWLDDEGDEA